MRIRLSLLPFLLVVLLTRAAPQAPPQTPPQTQPDQVLIQAGTHVVLVNVVAKDKHGRPVNDLSRGDFVVRDNGQERKITLFALEDAGETTPVESESRARMTFTNRPASRAGVTVFLFDELNTQLVDQQLARKDFLHYLKGLPAAVRVAVFVLGDSLSLLHDFSQDQASLMAALEKHPSRVNPEVEASTAQPTSANSLAGDQSTSALWDSFIQSSGQPYADYTQQVRATRTAAALETIAAHLQGIPGRKTLVWISGGFPIQLGLSNSVDAIPQGTPNARRTGGRSTGTGRQGGATGGSGATNQTTSGSGSTLSSSLPGTGLSFESDVEKAIRALNEADVAVYPVDARGVPVAAPFQADRSSIGKRSRPPKSDFAPDFNYETLETLAGETGGVAFHHINDLSNAIQEATADARVSYSLAFSPPEESLDDAYHHLEVTVNRRGVTLRYRPGYVAARDKAATPQLRDAIANPVAMAGIGFTLHLEPVEGGYKASVTIDPRNITLELKDGKWTGSLQFLVLVGKVEQLTTIPLNLSDALFHQIQEKGLVLGARVKTPPGTTGFSMGFRDIPSGMVGTLHVPL
jgi:VWFA-related protein